MSRLRPTITISLILLTILSLVVDAVLILNVYGGGSDNGVDKDIPSSIRQTGCVVGTFTAVYKRQGVDFTINRVFLCGDNLHYRFTNEAGLQVYNEKKEEGE